MREYYLHKRQNDIFYVEYINPEDGKKMSARSTGERTKSKPSYGKPKAYLPGGYGSPARLRRPPGLRLYYGQYERLRLIQMMP